MIRRRIRRAKRVFRKNKKPTPAQRKVYKKRVNALKKVYLRLYRVGRKSCNVNRNMRDVKKTSSQVSKSLKKVLELSKKAAAQPSGSKAAKTTQKKIADLLKQNIKTSSAISEKMVKSENCPCQNCGNCAKKTRMVQLTAAPAANATATAQVPKNMNLQYAQEMY